MNETTTILIIEDSAKVRENVQEILDLYGYRTLAAPDGLTGVRIAQKEVPDLILCDVMMPELDGYGVLNMLAENPDTSHIPFIFITARTEMEDMRRGMNLGADDYITKPFYKDELLGVIKTRLRKAATRLPEVSPAAESTLGDVGAGYAQLNAAFETKGALTAFDQGQHILRAGENTRFLYRMEAGHAHMTLTHEHGREYVLREISPGELFGLSTALPATTFRCSVRVVSAEATVTTLSKQLLLDLQTTHRSVSEAILHLHHLRIAEYDDRLMHQAYDSVRRRTALTLCRLHDKYNGEAIELSREDLAGMIGTAKESISRTLTEFRKDGHIVAEGRALRVLDPEALRSLMV